MTEKYEKSLDRIARAMEEMVRVQKRQLMTMKDGCLLSVLQYEKTMKTLSAYDEANKAIEKQIAETEEEISKWTQS